MKALTTDSVERTEPFLEDDKKDDGECPKRNSKSGEREEMSTLCHMVLCF